MRLTVTHQTVYRFDEPMWGVVQSHRLTPARTASQTVIDWAITVEGGTSGAAFRDAAGDWIETLTVRGPVTEIVIDVAGTVETEDTAGVLRGHRESMPPRAYLRPSRATTPDASLAALAEKAVEKIALGDTLAAAHALSHAITDAIAYTPGETHAQTTAAEALAQGKGVCQDHAHALIAAALCREIPARYVAGYLYSAADDAMAEASHAWAELYIPDLGWVGFDPANACCPDERYIRLGSGADAAEAAPIRGIALGEGQEALDVSVAVEQVQQ